jgi:hypothetical protein
MRELTKSLLSFSWSMSLFGVQQMGNLLARPDPNRPRSKVAEAFDSVTRVTEEQLGDILKESFKGGDKFQRALVDLMLGSWMTQGVNPGGVMHAAADAMRGTTSCCGQASGGGTAPGAAGWGPMPAADAPTA